MKLKSFATVAITLIPSLAFAAGGGGGTGISNAGNGGPSGANSDVSNGNTPPGPANGYFGNSASAGERVLGLDGRPKGDEAPAAQGSLNT
jgi:hypothetical protein